jgi:thiamine biosynthesis lipoprotein
MTQKQQNIFAEDDYSSIGPISRFSHEAMATTFEISIRHPDNNYAGCAALAAFAELERLEKEFSRFIENSDICRINNLGIGQSLQIGPETFECLQLSADIYNQTNGAFDITIGSLMDCWLDEDKNLRSPSKDQLDSAKAKTGMQHIKLDPSRYTVELLTEGIKIDLGGIGKGYAIDRMAELLRQWSIDTALINAGCSTVLALNAPARTNGWAVTLSHPDNRQKTLARIELKDQALSGSALEYGQHIIDPRTAEPASAKAAAWCCAEKAATADALSTAFMVISPGEINEFALNHPAIRALIVLQNKRKKQEQILHFGSWDDGQLRI